MLVKTIIICLLSLFLLTTSIFVVVNWDLHVLIILFSNKLARICSLTRKNCIFPKDHYTNEQTGESYYVVDSLFFHMLLV